MRASEEGERRGREEKPESARVRWEAVSRVSEALDGTCGAFGLHQELCMEGFGVRHLERGQF